MKDGRELGRYKLYQYDMGDINLLFGMRLPMLRLHVADMNGPSADWKLGHVDMVLPDRVAVEMMRDVLNDYLDKTKE